MHYAHLMLTTRWFLGWRLEYYRARCWHLCLEQAASQQADMAQFPDFRSKEIRLACRRGQGSRRWDNQAMDLSAGWLGFDGSFEQGTEDQSAKRCLRRGGMKKRESSRLLSDIFCAPYIRMYLFAEIRICTLSCHIYLTFDFSQRSMKSSRYMYMNMNRVPSYDGTRH